MNLTKWEPFRELDKFFSYYRYPPALNRNFKNDIENWAPTTDISETDKEYLIKAELPDVKKADVKVSAENGVLTISGERKHEKETSEVNEIRIESFYGSFSRSFYLPDNIDSSAIRAESADGVLRIHVPKAQETKAKAISIPVQ